MSKEDLFEFLDAAPPADAGDDLALRDPWRILVVDDDPDVHESTAYGLRGLDVEGLSLIHI